MRLNILIIQNLTDNKSSYFTFKKSKRMKPINIFPNGITPISVVTILLNNRFTTSKYFWNITKMTM